MSTKNAVVSAVLGSDDAQKAHERACEDIFAAGIVDGYAALADLDANSKAGASVGKKLARDEREAGLRGRGMPDRKTNPAGFVAWVRKGGHLKAV